ncbi:aminopeptidase P family protein [Cytobacillus depressus]|uniref:Aminopeptidase P family protein n=1 Tax=Cytobacillus depressus TaxID=1602942 RepID=A0A6L3V3W2_9BACI|nr:Xaa-Pro peptidase family protein [Cytobacillus depressus]KAB2334680.1 aminopeptidase P family protein [Cytobacillus depressus]
MQEQYHSRLNELKKHLENQNVEVAIIKDPKNVFYYTGFNSDPHERFMALVMDLRKGNQYLFVPALDEEIAEKDSYVKKIVTISDELNPYEVLKDTIDGNVGTFGLETKVISLYQHAQLNHFFSDSSYLNIGDFISGQRMKKSKEECGKIQNAIHVIEKVMAEGIKKVKAGMTEQDFTAELEFLMRKFGASGPSFSTIVLSGEKASLPHGRPDHKTINQGDFLLIDMGVIVDGYCSDITRTFVIGEETPKQREIYEIVKKSTEAGVNACKAGIPIGQIDIAARNVIKEAGYGQYFNNRVGHGLGIDVHEEPSVHENNDLIVESGLLFTIEPGIYIPGYGGVRIEENVYIDEDGKGKLLTSFPTELIRIG